MNEEGIFRWLGNTLGDALRVVVETVGYIFSKLGSVVHAFFGGLAGSMGVDASLLNILWILLGVWMLFSGIRAFARGSILAGIIWLFLVTVLFGLLISGPAQAAMLLHCAVCL